MRKKSPFVEKRLYILYVYIHTCHLENMPGEGGRGRPFHYSRNRGDRLIAVRGLRDENLLPSVLPAVSIYAPRVSSEGSGPGGIRSPDQGAKRELGNIGNPAVDFPLAVLGLQIGALQLAFNDDQ